MIWTAIRTACKARWVVVDHDTWCGVLVELDGELQKIVLEPTTRIPSQLNVGARVCRIDAFPPGEALRYNARSARGQLGVEGDFYLLRELRALALDGLELAVEELGREAIRLRRITSPARDLGSAAAPFVHYTE